MHLSLSPPGRTRAESMDTVKDITVTLLYPVTLLKTSLEGRAVGCGDNAVEVEVWVRGEVVHLDVFDICGRLHRGLLVHLFV